MTINIRSKAEIPCRTHNFVENAQHHMWGCAFLYMETWHTISCGFVRTNSFDKAVLCKIHIEAFVRIFYNMNTGVWDNTYR